MTKQEALNVLIAVACCSTAELTCMDCPRCDKGIGGEYPSEDACEGWNEHEVADAVRVLREVEVLYGEK